MSLSAREQPPITPPSQDPQRKEALLISHLEITGQREAVVLLEMQRDPQGKLIGLREIVRTSDAESEVHSPLLRAFVDGFRLGTLTRRGKRT